jgi:hypothetical protein
LSLLMAAASNGFWSKGKARLQDPGWTSPAIRGKEPP